MYISQIATKIVSGDQALEFLRNYENEKIFVVCDAFLSKGGMLDLIMPYIQDRNDVMVFDDITPDPTLDVIAGGVLAAAKFSPTVLIGFGGGAAIDTAKGIVYVAVGDGVLKTKPVFVAIPTTSGTGSEMTAFTVLTDVGEQKKIAIIDDIMCADVAILDAKLTVSVPPSVTANTGFDVITHSMEAYVAKGATDFTDAMAVQSLELAIDALPRCYHYGANMKARQDMMSASNLAGIAFNLGGLGLVHSMAHQLGGMFHVPHGLACAIFLPIGIAYNSTCPETADKYARLAYKLGIVPRSVGTDIAARALPALFSAFMSDMSMPKRVGELTPAVSRADYEAAVEMMAANALEDRCLAQTPVPVTKEIFIDLFKQAY